MKEECIRETYWYRVMKPIEKARERSFKKMSKKEQLKVMWEFCKELLDG